MLLNSAQNNTEKQSDSVVLHNLQQHRIMFQSTASCLVFVTLVAGVLSDASTSTKDLKYELNNGNFMPAIGLGTSRITGADRVKDVLDKALAAGYRQFDTAAAYNNEEDIGNALEELLPKYNLTRNDIFITTKFSPWKQGENVTDALHDSLRKLKTPYIDLYLIHWPGAGAGVNKATANFTALRAERWQKMVKALKDGLVKNIGVSNYAVKHLRELLANDFGTKPAVNQGLWNPLYHPAELLELCRKEGILLEAYSSLGGTHDDNLLQNEDVKKVAEKLGKTPAQVLLRWAVQQNIAIIPKATSKQHLEDNLNLDFTLPDEDVSVLNGFPQKRNPFSEDTP
ncbi:aldo-keto reductase Mvan_2161-like [Cylas formicarius]|uniref:aldo-keto reductase Mvan_2161-like n=1 Tax=Cylas formicarius TaxID=197179 RepID=UPI0029586FFC|nr:aldo-keto reductase Mvan_2161-like [Cylas formicarius]